MIEMLRRWKQGKGEVQHLVKHMGLRNTVLSSFVNDLILFLFMFCTVLQKMRLFLQRFDWQSQPSKTIDFTTKTFSPSFLRELGIYTCV